MYAKKIEEDLDCGIRVAFKIFGGKWKLCIIDAINKGITRPIDIQKEIRIASQRVIEMQLAELLSYGVVEKCSEDVYPKKSEYELTEMGKTILPVLKQIDNWGTANSAFVKLRQYELERAGED
ncbi:helix-turn-helix transcriptional regulator [Flavobacterium salilacus subsp. salilacus]|uniref:winged helix-turn-helix transcriptional regulator n=1 Tax=Flavobacterium TaxID=237 RepID=UPI001074ECFC|nr:MULTISPECIES: helix-turn-helix domain-containing protein [Flavobacterium]KAF2519688.1 helix-turn-helix transcriptional regulator [Flavobacterium salilacus subsp. salilacus]MBE1614424.1 helix-turn-helix transcriptional regulator [Flavobacterium sp. SaA2.13]